MIVITFFIYSLFIPFEKCFCEYVNRVYLLVLYETVKVVFHMDYFISIDIFQFFIYPIDIELQNES